MAIIHPSDPVPRYVRLAQLLRQRISKAMWKAGEHLPSLEILMKEFTVSRVTVRQAIAILAREGLVSVGRGRGTVVQPQFQKRQDKTLQLETSLADLAKVYRNDQPTLTLLDENKADLPPLPDGCGAPVKNYRHLKRVHSRNNEPYCLISIHLDEKVFNKAPQRFRSETIIPVLLDLPEIVISRAQQTLRISIADVEAVKLLNLPLNSAVGEVVRVFHNSRGQVMYVAEITYRAEFIHFQMDLKV